ncbi:formin-like protein 4 [Hordeum vulgare subsp. vulgare]|uniref:Formin-like protein n=1 Tax=Hordeum vulgare subsp. vulgare TaxID=112509 RepID=A0A8I6WID3_HORVV|nr:formin-like protein 4 [Hordeum vulgare subsp. vulgare]
MLCSNSSSSPSSRLQKRSSSLSLAAAPAQSHTAPPRLSCSPMPLSLALLLTLASLLLPAAVVADGTVRRLLHEPLFPIEWTPPPSPPASAPPPPGFSSDPSTPAPPDTVTPAPPQPSTVPAVVSSPGGPAPRVHGGGGTPKAAIVVASAAAAAFLALFAFAAAFLLTGRVPRHPVQPRVPEHPGGHTHVSGSSGPSAAVAGSSTASHYRKARHERARRGICHDVDTVPSPELRPLPPLRRESDAVVGSSEEEAAYYTPGQRSAGSGGGEGRGTWTEASASSSSARTTTASRLSLPSLTSDFFPTTPVAAAASASTAAPPPAPPVQRSRRTTPGTRFSAGPASANPPPPQPQTFNNTISMRRSLNPARAEDPSVAVRAAPVMAMMKENEEGSSMRMHGNDGARPGLKPLHREKVRGASSDESDMVWGGHKSNSFQSEEDMIEVVAMNHAGAKRAGMSTQLRREERVLDPEKEESIAILMRALNVTPDEVSDALLNGNGECLGAEHLETLVKMAPTKEEELKLRDFTGESSKLGSVECFLKAVLDIPFAFKRVDAMLYRANFENEIVYLRKCFQTIEAACDDLKGSRLFLRLLEAVLRTGNKMNVGTNWGDAKASKLDTLLKLAVVKCADGKTTLLHFAVKEIARQEDEKSGEVAENHIQFRKHGLKVVSALSSELGSVKKAATMDFDVLHGYVSRLETGIGKITSVIMLEKQCRKGEGFFAAMRGFLKEAEQGIKQVRHEERKAMERVKEITGYFHGNTAKEEAHPLRMFMVVRDFIAILDRVCREIGQQDRVFVGSARSFRASATSPSPLLSMHGQRGRDNNSDEAVLLGAGNVDQEQ